MQSSRLFSTTVVVAISAAAAVFACGGSGSKGSSADAPSGGRMDGGAFMDAPSAGGGLTLGKKCGSAADCPANAPECTAIGLPGGSASPSFCTPDCDTNASGMTNAQGQFTSLTPAPNNGTCTSAYTGAGMPSCGLLLAWTPMDNPLKANKQYTAIKLGCLVKCGANNTCAAGMTCNTSAMLCFPN